MKYMLIGCIGSFCYGSMPWVYGITMGGVFEVITFIKCFCVSQHFSRTANNNFFCICKKTQVHIQISKGRQTQETLFSCYQVSKGKQTKKYCFRDMFFRWTLKKCGYFQVMFLKVCEPKNIVFKECSQGGQP